MSLLVVGSVAFDAVETPFGKIENMLGGAAAHSQLLQVTFRRPSRRCCRGDFGSEEQKVLMLTTSTRQISKNSDGKTFRWFGRYDYDLNVAHTLDTHLNVFADFQPKLSDTSKKARLVFWQIFNQICNAV